MYVEGIDVFDYLPARWPGSFTHVKRVALQMSDKDHKGSLPQSERRPETERVKETGFLQACSSESSVINVIVSSKMTTAELVTVTLHLQFCAVATVYLHNMNSKYGATTTPGILCTKKHPSPKISAVAFRRVIRVTSYVLDVLRPADLNNIRYGAQMEFNNAFFLCPGTPIFFVLANESFVRDKHLPRPFTILGSFI
ncbi:uncharacterized protein BT62DRAFT_1013332 [Guyanagaster necrorhizus]|uniref:Uncharacterized protein n=1 Tax=Guyanagaster necrorhizus TaxID=856835 RepID=A0A9P7VG01_9AGAR|nr:uncharacterized protein BT62DRAFT_1013332 [Guyanagaster necrorhizus MCA 3950]KAG7439883.1 hypothetical protein BT62DRAFT_1013332 [Guyanagaster necrorhizus MCA 3950]